MSFEIVLKTISKLNKFLIEENIFVLNINFINSSTKHTVWYNIRL